MAADLTQIQQLVKALEAGQYNASPSTLVQGSALQVEDLSPVMELVTFDNEHIKLQKMLKVEACKSMLAQFNRQLSYGQWGGTAQYEGSVGVEQTSDYVRIVVPMCFYSQIRKVSLQATLVATADGVKADDRAAKDAAMSLAADIEFDLFRGKADFSNAGVFDGNPLSIPQLPNILGVDPQLRQSDAQRNAQDLMFASFGSSESIVIQGGGASVATSSSASSLILTQENIEDASVRSALNFGNADKLLVDPKVLSAYNKLTYGQERIILAGSPIEATANDLRRQWVSGGTVNVEASQFLRGRTQPDAPKLGSNQPAAPATIVGSNSASGSLATGYYSYYVTGVNEIGEGVPAAVTNVHVTGAGYTIAIVAASSGSVPRYYRVYRSGVSASSTAQKAIACKFVGAVEWAGTTTTFTDLGNKSPGFVTGFLVQGDTMEMKELAPYSRKKLAETDLSMTEAHFRFVTLAVMQPRKNVLVDNLQGTSAF